MNSKWIVNEENLITILADSTCTTPELYIKLRGTTDDYIKIDKPFIDRGSGEFDIHHIINKVGKYFIKITNIGDLDNVIQPIDVISLINSATSCDEVNPDDIQKVIDKLEELKVLINDPWDGIPDGQTLKYKEILIDIQQNAELIPTL